MQVQEIKDEFYSEKSLNELLEEDSISSEEYAFMIGYVQN